MTERAGFLGALIGRRYDPARFNCWHTARLIQSTLFGRDLPLADLAMLPGKLERIRLFRDHPARADWREISAPVDGAFVLMGRGVRNDHHCGVWLAEDGGRVWHNDEPHGVVDDTPLELAQSRRWRLSYFLPNPRA